MKRSNTIFLNKQEAALLGISDPKNQEVYLKNQKLNLHNIDRYKNEIFLPKGTVRGYLFLNDPLIRDDELKTINFASNSTIDYSSLYAFSVLDKSYLTLAYNKTKDYLVSKGIWNQEILAWFLSNPKEQNWNNEQIQSLLDQCSKLLIEESFDFNKLNAQINSFRIDNENLAFDNKKFIETKALLHSKLDVISILVYLKSLLIESNYKKVLIENNETLTFNGLNLKNEEFFPFSFERSDYKLRRSMLSNSVESEIDSLLWDPCPECYKTNKEYQNSVLEYGSDELTDTSSANLKPNNKIIISELKATDDTLLNEEQIANLEKEFYAPGSINYLEQYDDDDYEEAIEDIEHYEKGHQKVLERHQSHQHTSIEKNDVTPTLVLEHKESNLNLEEVPTKTSVEPLIQELNKIYKEHSKSTLEINQDKEQQSALDLELIEEIQTTKFDLEKVNQDNEVEIEFIESKVVEPTNKENSKCISHCNFEQDSIIPQLIQLKKYRQKDLSQNKQLSKQEELKDYYSQILKPLPTCWQHQAWINRNNSSPMIVTEEDEYGEEWVVLSADLEYETSNLNNFVPVDLSCKDVESISIQQQNLVQENEIIESDNSNITTPRSNDQILELEQEPCFRHEINEIDQQQQQEEEEEVVNVEQFQNIPEIAKEETSLNNNNNKFEEATIAELKPTNDTLLNESEINELEKEFYSISEINHIDEYKHQDYEESCHDIEHYEEGYEKVEHHHQSYKNVRIEDKVVYEIKEEEFKSFDKPTLDNLQMDSLSEELNSPSNIENNSDVKAKDLEVIQLRANDDITTLIDGLANNNDSDFNIYLETHEKKTKKWFWKKK